MDDLIAFLRARLDETEQLATAATAGPWTYASFGQIVGGPGHQFVIASQMQAWNHNHITHHDPARVMADVAAKRRIIDLHKLGGTYNLGDQDTPEADWLHYCATCGSGEPYEYPTNWPCKTLLLLALPYADHPEYREEWRV